MKLPFDPSDAALISHGGQSAYSLDQLLPAIRARLSQAGDMPGATVAQQLEVLEALSSFELGRFLLTNRGLNAEWTHRLVSYSSADAVANISPLERMIVEELPAVLATRERYGVFRQQLQLLLRPGLVLASLPCGLMGELLSLDYCGLADVGLVGVDLDPAALAGAQTLARRNGLAERLTLHCRDAWSGLGQAPVDVLTSNGLNIYEPDDARVVALYRAFHAALKPGGTLLTSFLTPPPTLSPASPWRMEQLDPAALALQYLLFVRIIEAKWSAFRTHEQTRNQLEQAGFTDIRFIDDRACLFPTVLACKPRD
ncbi:MULTISPECIES: cyclopropane-fatty-acyl-phospholipid synthase family protein [unclassified Duganella]|uniref:SAM-dependent methyltransferase n=1 Tax=unclassified Duganella TaxID=2636909 RepID=UPI000E341E21|nr:MULTISPECIES: class I SAM-dependent methyltransferase [unclassified Duganella]RFP09378.1 class I SAM-dependent methyltransferase [Duganella sp. BJB475]RFP25473.1 class I SAM-dependent methyltransferase [Duganella sp. BJB476]